MWLTVMSSLVLVVAAFLIVMRKAELRPRIVWPWAFAVTPLSVWAGIVLSRHFAGPLWLWAAFLALAVAGTLTLAVVLVLFSRDPDRTPLKDDSVILSPADGKIVYIHGIQNGQTPIAVKKGRSIALTEFAGGPESFPSGFHIGIMMSYLDVHVNRAPIEGTVERLRRVPGAFRSLKSMDSLLENERVFSMIRGKTVTVGIVQIASRIVRRIVPFVKEGDRVAQGGRFGVIRLGSQVDMIIPCAEALSLQVRVGDYVKAGLSVLARLGPCPDPRE